MIKYDFKEKADNIKYESFADKACDVLFFDIETTGLKAARSDLYIIGYAVIDNDSLNITLLFNNDGCSEPEMLECFSEVLSQHKNLVTYNGDTFDIPYIKEKYRQFEIPVDLSHIESTDIYKYIRKYKKQLHMESMKQSDIEDLMGIHRKSFISGGDLINTYREYLKTKSNKLLNQLITHNKDDISGLANITGIMAVYLFLKCCHYIVSDIKLEDDRIAVSLGLASELPIRLSFEYRGVLFTGYGDNATAYIPYIRGTLKHYFKDYKSYYYLPLEDTAIHKSVGTYVDSAHRKKATKETAYIKKSGLFIRLYDCEATNVFKKDFSSREAYIELDDEFLKDHERIWKYIAKLLP